MRERANPADWSRPTAFGRRELARLHGRLRNAGVPAGPHGYDLATLEIACAAFGWASDAGPAGAGDPAPFVGAVLPGDGRAWVGWGWSAAVALARALDAALANDG